jgi:hypothetical protein
MDKVYIANFGQGNSLWPQAKANSTIATFDDMAIHEFWRAGDREGYIEASVANTFTALGARPTRQTASRWFNLATELSETSSDLWVSRQGNDVWWSMSLDEPFRETLQLSDRPQRNGPNVWVLEKPCSGWSNRDKQGRPLIWDALHPKARDFLATEGTFQSLKSGDLGNAEYAKALTEGLGLGAWHMLPAFKQKYETAKSKGGRTFSPKEIMAARIARTVLATVAAADGRTVTSQAKVKNSTLTLLEWEAALRMMFDEQDGKCGYTGFPMQLDSEEDDKEMLASLDRIDSAGHYELSNVHLVCRFINRWKGADDHEKFQRLLARLHGPTAFHCSS